MDVLKVLKEYNVKLRGNEDEKELQIIYDDLKKKYFIRDKKYNVIVSKNFMYRYPLLTKNQKIAINDIKDRLENGLTIRPYLSNNHYIEKASKEDELLTLHNIYHLHLNFAGKYERHVKRTGKLLFITYDNENVYFLDVKKHPIGIEWNDEDIINIKREIMEEYNGS